jgi:nitrate reductase gamma subunit
VKQIIQPKYLLYARGIWIISLFFSQIFLCVFFSHYLFFIIITCLFSTFLIYLSSHSQNKELKKELERNQRRGGEAQKEN